MTGVQTCALPIYFGFRSVKIDDVNASYELTLRIIKDGRKSILFLGPHTKISVLRDRFIGYKMALKNNGIPYRKDLVIESFRSVEDAYKKVSAVLEQGIQFDAILSVGGLITYGAGKAILEAGKKIPDDVIIGEFGGNDVVYKLRVPFYTVFQNPQEIGRASIDMLINMIETGKPNEEFEDIRIDTEVIQV